MAKSNWILQDFDKNSLAICEAASSKQREQREVRPGQPRACFEEKPSSHWWEMVLLVLMMLPLSKFSLAAIWTEAFFLIIYSHTVCVRSRDGGSLCQVHLSPRLFHLISVYHEVVELASRNKDNCNNSVQ